MLRLAALIATAGALNTCSRRAVLHAPLLSALPAAADDEQLIVSTVRRPDACDEQARRGDLLSIFYEARYRNERGAVVYDSSAARLGSQPFRLVLGDGSAVPGLELPARVRPWVQLCLPTAQLSILGHASPWLDPASLARPC